MSYSNVDKPDEKLNHEPQQSSIRNSLAFHDSHASAGPASGLISAENSVLTTNSIQECHSYRIPIGVQPTTKQDAHGKMLKVPSPLTAKENYKSKPLQTYNKNAK